MQKRSHKEYQNEGVVAADSVRLERRMQVTAGLPLHKHRKRDTERKRRRYTKDSKSVKKESIIVVWG